ncbi:MAG: acyl-CoA dehydratase activase [Gemmatimonadota bacterium]|nr:acyl-CoA dehydratase activase [Gemmatimonadota bacterium]MDH3479347.1 acyl-CoA dehydratase activase [Gemmatimonadota bacterium]
MTDVFLGIDVGSTTVKAVAVDRTTSILAQRYVRAHGQPRPTIRGAVRDVLQVVDPSDIRGVGLTGSGGGPTAALIGGSHVNELIAQTRALGELYPQARTVIEIGGQDSKFLSLQWDADIRRMTLLDFAMNTVCAAGTGSFLDQQAERLGITIDREFSTLALESRNPARIAGRCTVFAKSDMIHLQQKGTPLPDILAGLCLALARNFKSTIGKGKAFIPPILFQGGVAYNGGVVRAFETALKLESGELIVPEHHWLMPAIGAALLAMDEVDDGRFTVFRGLDPLETAVRTAPSSRKSLAPLSAPTPSDAGAALSPLPIPSSRETVYVGIDVGSISTKVVLIDRDARVLAHRYLPTAGAPLDAVRRGLREVGMEADGWADVRGVGATGSGRYLTADFVGADVVRNEITAQARAATAIDPTVDTIFEIGGQDSKYVRLDHGAVVDFAMNSACAAGTGSFLEEQADRLRIDIERDFSRLALSSAAPACLGERCTVFMESDLVHHQQQGAGVNELAAGLAYSIAQNYLNRVVDGRAVGRNVFFQGGVAGNSSVVAALRMLTGRRITVPPHHEVTGAIGVAILALEQFEVRREQSSQDGDLHLPTRFRGFDLSTREYEATTFECKACANLCEISQVVIDHEAPIFYGARCDKFEEAGRTPAHGGAAEVPDLFAERTALLLGDYAAPNGRRNGRRRVAIPRALVFHDLFPYWRTFFGNLDIELVLSDSTNPRILRTTLEAASVETCLPVKLVYGHVLDLVEQDADFIFLPSVINRENVAPGQAANMYCPFIPAASHLVRAHVESNGGRHRVLHFPLHLLWDQVGRGELKQLAGQLGVAKRRIGAAAAAGAAAQREFYADLRRRGREVLEQLDRGRPAAVLVGRPYNACDPGACQDLPLKVRKLGVLPIPMDFLPLETVDVSARYGNMFWRSGQDILAAATLIRDDPRLHAIYLTNFNCGPDSFIISFFREIMGDKPFLELELDDHMADAGVVTRCEAFFESLGVGRGRLGAST